MTKKITISIVGRVNVGKSTLFNNIIGAKKAMVANIPRVTRDRNIALVERFSKPFIIIDTGGFEREKNDIIAKKIGLQIRSAIEESEAVIFLVDGKEGINPLDIEIFNELRVLKEKFEKTVYVVVNKIDDPVKHRDKKLDFFEFGRLKIYSVSAETGYGVSDLIEEMLSEISIFHSPSDDQRLMQEEMLKLVVIGKPNVGKSSFINSIAGNERLIVDDVSGTTRDPIDVDLLWNNKKIKFIDTAGMRKKAKVTERVEKLSHMFAQRTIERSDIIILMIDALDGFTDQDIRTFNVVEEKGKSIIIVVNKSDLLRDKKITKNEVKEKLRHKFYFGNYVPVIFISVKTREGYNSLFKKIVEVEDELAKKIKTSKLNDFFIKIIAAHGVPIRQTRRPKIYYVTQVKSFPPTFILFCNYPDLFDQTYKKYVMNQFRKKFNFQGVPVKFVYKKK